MIAEQEMSSTIHDNVENIVLGFKENDPVILDNGLSGLVDIVSANVKYPVAADDLETFKRHMLIIRQSDDQTKISEIFSLLLRRNGETTPQSIATSTLVLMCLPHIRPIHDLNQAWTDSRNYIKKLLDSIDVDKSSGRSTYEINKLKSFSACQGIICMKLLTSAVQNGNEMFEQMIQEFDLRNIMNNARPWGINSYSSVFSLQLLDFAISLNNQHEGYFKMQSNSLDLLVNDIIKPNISSPISKCRLFALHILTQLYPKTVTDHNESADLKSLFVLAYESDKVPPTYQEFREKLRLLSYLNSCTIDRYKPPGLNEETNQLFSLLTFRYLLSITYINLSHLWKPIIDLLKSYIDNKKYQRAVMTILFDHLQETNSMIYHESNLEDETITIDFLNGSLPSPVASGMNNLVSYVLDRIDPLNHRVLIYQTMCHFPHVVEMMNKEFMDAFFLFADKELMKPPFLEKFRFEDLRKDKTPIESSTNDSDQEHDETINTVENEADDADETGEAIEAGEAIEVDEVESDDEEVEDNDAVDEDSDTEKSEPKQKRLTFGRRMSKKMQTHRTFLEIMKVIWNFKNIRCMKREAEFRDLMLQLLSNRDTSIQHAAFRCILAYNHDYIEPYVAKIFRILKDRTFESEIAAITFEDQEELPSGEDKLDQTIQDVHRSELVPLLMRILYGKMIGKAARKSSGKSKSAMRRSKEFVIRFIAKCSEKEIQFFLNLAFEPFIKYTDVDYSDLPGFLEENMDISQFIPNGKMQAMLGTLTTVMKLVANLRPTILPFILKIINIASFMVVQLINNEKYCSNLSKGTIFRFKVRRRQCYDLVDEFFKQFVFYEFRRDEINMIFDQLVWPMLPELVDQSYEKPTPLLSLFLTWSNYVRYLPLLVKHQENDLNEYPLKRIILLYSESKTERPVLTCIAKIFANLLSQGTEDDSVDDELCMEVDQELGKSDEEEPMIDIDHMIIPSYNREDFKFTTGQIDFGTTILISSFPIILDRLQQNCRKIVEDKNSSFRMEAHELKVLSFISRFVKDPSQSQISASLLLTSLKSLRSENIQLETARAIQVLLEQVITITDEHFVRNLASLFGFQRGLSQRTELCKLLQIVGQKRPDLAVLADIISLFNTRSQQFVEILDIEARLEGFKKLFAYIDSITSAHLTETILDALYLIIYQIINFLNSAEQQDFTTRDNCLIFFEKLAFKMKETESDSLFQTIVIDTILDKSIKKGLRNTSETIRHLYIGILRSFAIWCNKRDTTLSEFYLLCDEKNADLDFWINIRHIQLHSRSKALARLYGSDKEKILSFSPKTLSSYILPIATNFLFVKTYACLGSLVENSIKVVGLICRTLNWNTYESVLTYHLENLVKASSKHQKTRINLLTEILKNFNFDLSSCPDACANHEEELKEDARIAKKQRKRNQLRDSSIKEVEIELKPKKLNPSSARHVYLSVTQKIIPKLNSCLHEVTRAEFEHDKQMKDDLPEKDEIRRIPIAFAIVQLLNLLPGRRILIRNNLPSIFLKLCSFLKSRSEPVRHASRVTISKIMQFLGPDYFPTLLRELRQALHKGFQIHVLNFTIHSVLDKLTLVYGDLDDKACELVSLSLEEIFGDISDDKEIAQILAKTAEAKKTKGYDTLMIVASVISHEALTQAMVPMKELMKTTSEAKKVSKLSICLKKFFTGLSHNQEFPPDKFLTFIKNNIEESIPSLKVAQTMEVAVKPAPAVREDRFLIVDDLPRDRVKARINERGNYHFVVENSLRLLLSLIQKNQELFISKDNLSSELNQFLSLLPACLKAHNPKSVARALKCLYFIIKSQNISSAFCNKIVKRVFILLNKYNGVGMAQGENQEMIMMCFKTLNLLMIKTKEVTITRDHLRALLSYVDQDINDTGRQATAFRTLKALLSRNLNCPELPEVMSKVSRLLIQSEDANVRRMSSQAWQTYLLKYPHGKNLQNLLLTFVRQLEYPHVDGRIATLTLLKSIISNFPVTIINANRDLLFLPLASRLVNEESLEATKIVSVILSKLLTNLDDENGREIYDSMVIPWSKSDSLYLRTMSVKLMSIFLSSKLEIFSGTKTSRIKTCLDTVVSELEQSKEEDSAKTEKILKNGQNGPNENSSSDSSRIINDTDKHVYHVLVLFYKLLDFNLVESDDKRFRSTLSSIWQTIANCYLTHWYLPVVIISSQLYNNLLSKYTEEELTSSIKFKTDSNSKDYVKRNAKQIVTTLCNRYIKLIDRVNESEELQENVTRSLIHLGKVLLNLNECEQNQIDRDQLARVLACDLTGDGLELLVVDDEEEERGSQKKKDFAWLSRKMIMQARKEVALKRSTDFHRRITVFTWLAAMSMGVSKGRMLDYSFAFLIPLARELTDRSKLSKGADSERKRIISLAEQVVNMIKQILGPSAFNQIYTKVQLHLTKKRVERKKAHAIMKITDQARGIKRKNQQRTVKKDSKLRKAVQRKRVRME